MKNYFILDSKNEIVSTARCDKDTTIEIDGDNTLVEVTTNIYNEYMKLRPSDTILFDKDEKVVIPVKQYKNTDWSFITFSEDKVNNASIIRDSSGEAILNVGSKEWMRNSKHAILELIDQYNLAYGDVLIGGLGMGIVALMVASKPEVTSVTVVEFNKDIIELFNNQKFNTNKITIVNENLYNHSGKYDCALMDYYNIEDMDNNFIMNESSKLRKIDAQHWNWYLQNKVEAIVTQDVVNAIHYINDNKGRTSETINNLNDFINKAIDSIKDYDLPYDDSTEFRKDYFIYNIDNAEYQAVGITWNYFDKVYSIKYQYGEITDFYEIYKTGDIFSSEIDINTKEVVCNYPHHGDNKVDLDGNVIQVNNRITKLSDLPSDIIDLLINQNFPYINDIFYYSQKPYGKVVECRIPKELKDTK